MIREMRESLIDSNPTLEEQRATSEGFAMLTAEPAVAVAVELVDAGGVPAQWLVPQGAATDRVLLYLHGGGYVVGSMHSHRKLASHIAAAIGCRALNVDYRLAPEHPHPAAVTDAVTVYRWLLDQGVQPAHIVVSGDSAGGGLTLALLVALAQQGIAQPALAVPLSPWAELEGNGETAVSNAEVDMMVSMTALKTMADAFLGGGDPRDPLAAPVYADLRGISPLYIQVGGHETLLDNATRIASRAAAAGVDVRLDVFPEMQHVFQIAAGNIPEADDAIARIAAHARPRLGLTA